MYKEQSNLKCCLNCKYHTFKFFDVIIYCDYPQVVDDGILEDKKVHEFGICDNFVCQNS